MVDAVFRVGHVTQQAGASLSTVCISRWSLTMCASLVFVRGCSCSYFTGCESIGADPALNFCGAAANFSSNFAYALSVNFFFNCASRCAICLPLFSALVSPHRPSRHPTFSFASLQHAPQTHALKGSRIQELMVIGGPTAGIQNAQRRLVNKVWRAHVEAHEINQL